MNGVSAPSAYQVTTVSVDSLLPTEAHYAERAEQLRRQILSQGAWTVPILVHDGVLAILDGHHRWTAARALGLKRVPAILIGYNDHRLSLGSWRSDITVQPADIITAALSGVVLPPKTSRHVLHPSVPAMYLPLHQLTCEDEFVSMVPVECAVAQAAPHH